MFTGIIEEIGYVQSLMPHETGIVLGVKADKVLEDLKLGGSLAINGCCLTCVALQGGLFTAEIVIETMRCTSFSDISLGDAVNLERPLKVSSRLDGHLVQGHVDAVGTIVSKESLPDGSWQVTIKAPENQMRYLIEKGSIAVDGTSLTVWNVTENTFSFAMIPHTAKNTTLGMKGPGAKVNLEIDLIAKYIEKLSQKKS